MGTGFFFIAWTLHSPFKGDYWHPTSVSDVPGHSVSAIVPPDGFVAFDLGLDRLSEPDQPDSV